jgi:hypothetical protein
LRSGDHFISSASIYGVLLIFLRLQ